VKLRRRHNATLLELLVAMGLLSILLSVLFGFYWQIRKMEEVADNIREENFNLRYVQYRLTRVIPAIRGKKEKDFFFYTSEQHISGIKGQSFVFTYDNGVDVYPWFSNGVLGRLFVDEQDQLCLATWPLPTVFEEERYRMKKEILFSGVEELRFSFFFPEVDPDRPVKGEGVDEPTRGQWHAEWKKETKQLPALMKVVVVLHETKEELLFSFVIPKTDDHIVYRH